MERHVLNKCTCTGLVAVLLFVLGLNDWTILPVTALIRNGFQPQLSVDEPESAAFAQRRRWSQPRPHVFDLSDFGAVGDGATDNTRVFQNAIYAVSTVADKGGGQLYVPPGVYVTGSFNLTSCMTLYLSRDAVIKGIEVSGGSRRKKLLKRYGTTLQLLTPRSSH